MYSRYTVSNQEAIYIHCNIRARCCREHYHSIASGHYHASNRINVEVILQVNIYGGEFIDHSEMALGFSQTNQF